MYFLNTFAIPKKSKLKSAETLKRIKEFMSLDITKTLAECAQKEKTPCYLIGGSVRDLLLGREIKDIDVVAVGSGIEMARAFGNLFSPKLEVHVFKRFGTAMLKTKDWEIEFVGARKESYNRNSRKPVVEEGTLQDDQKRRDFTINALSISLNEENYGELIDPFDGLIDLEKKIIRTPLHPDKTFSDDPLRMMRAIRFACQLGFELDPITKEGIKKNHSRIEIVSKERIIDELNKIILSPLPSRGFKYLEELGLLELFFPELTDLKGVERRGKYAHKDNFYHTLQVLDNISENTDNLWLRWSALLHDIAKPITKQFEKGHGFTFHGHEDKGARMVPKIFRRLKLPLDSKMKYVQKLVRLHLRPIALVKDEVSDSGIRRLLFDAGEDLEDLMCLCEADITSKNEFRVKRYRENFKKVRNKLKEVEEKDRIRNWQPPLSGEDVMKCFDLKPSYEVGQIKNAIKEAILNGKIENNRQQAIEFMLEFGTSLGLKGDANKMNV